MHVLRVAESFPSHSHAIIHVGLDPRDGSCDSRVLVDGWAALVPGGLFVFDRLDRAYAPGGVYPWRSFNERFTPSLYRIASLDSGWPAPKSWLDTLSIFLHARPVASELSDAEGLAIAALTRSIDCWPSTCILRKSGAADVPLSDAEASAIASTGPWSAIAARIGTDKVTTHAYGWLYDRYIPRFVVRAQATKIKVRLLEIGLGCNMGYGAGKSALTWQEVFARVGVDITYLEYNSPCLEKWLREVGTPAGIVGYAGDQRDEALLARIVAERGPFDIVVEDGGHSMAMQVHSVRTLVRGLAPGGVFILEDLETTFMPELNGDGPPFGVGYVLDLVDLVVGGEVLRANAAFSASLAPPVDDRRAAQGFTEDQVAVAGLLEHIDTYREAVALVRKINLTSAH